VAQLLRQKRILCSPARLEGLLRERFSSLSVVLPNIERIEMLEMHPPVSPLGPTPEDEAMRRRDRWVGQLRSPFARAIVPSGIASWVVLSTWAKTPLRIDWEVERPTAPIDIEARGHILFAPHENATRVEVRGEITVAPHSGSRGLGTMLRLTGSKIERVLCDVIAENLEVLLAHAEHSIVAAPRE
jgi:hypothetical protein